MLEALLMGGKEKELYPLFIADEGDSGTDAGVEKVNAETGESDWYIDLGSAERFSGTAVCADENGNCYLAYYYFSTRVKGYDPDGNLIGETSAYSDTKYDICCEPDGSYIYVLTDVPNRSEGSYLYKYKVPEFTQEWRATVVHDVTTAIYFNGDIYVAGRDGVNKITALGSVWSTKPVQFYSATGMAVNNDILYIASNSGIQSFSLPTLNSLNYVFKSPNATGICTDPQGNVIVCYQSETVEKLTPDLQTTLWEYSPSNGFSFFDVKCDVKGNSYILVRGGANPSFVRVLGPDGEAIDNSLLSSQKRCSSLGMYQPWQFE